MPPSSHLPLEQWRPKEEEEEEEECEDGADESERPLLLNSSLAHSTFSRREDEWNLAGRLGKGEVQIGQKAVRWFATGLSVCALCLLLYAAVNFTATRRSVHRSASAASVHSSLLYSTSTDWQIISAATTELPIVASASASVSSAAFSRTPFPPLSSLVLSLTASSIPPPGLNSFVGCITASASPPAVAVVSTRSPHPTAAMLSVAARRGGWCVLALSDGDGAAWKEWASDTSRAAALSDYEQAMSLLPTDTAAAATNRSSPGQFLAASAFSRLSYIDRSEQRLLPYSVSPLLEANAADVRHLGYLLAVHAGATAILDLHEHSVDRTHSGAAPSDDPLYEQQPAHFLLAQPTARIATQQRQGGVQVELFNPHPLFGQPNSWPRGFPLAWAGATLPSTAQSPDNVYPSVANSTHSPPDRRLCRPVVQHFLSNRYTDVSGVSAVAGAASSARLPFDFLAPLGRGTAPHLSRVAPAVAVPRGAYTPFNARSTMFLPEVYAALVLPSSVPQRMADVVRAYILQTAVTYSGEQQHDHCVIVAPPRFTHLEPSSANAASEELLWTAPLERLLLWLTARQKGASEQSHVSFQAQSQLGAISYGSVLQWLYRGLTAAGELAEADQFLLSAWLSDLARLPQGAAATAHSGTTTVQNQSAALAGPYATSLSLYPLASSASDSFPSYSLPSTRLSSASAPLNLPAQPDAVLASDGVSYPLSAYPDGFLFPDKYAPGALIDERPLHNGDQHSVRPFGRWLPYPPSRHPPKPRVDFILRAFSGYSPLTSAMLRSLDVFVPWRALGEVIVVLDDSDADRQYAASLPDDVRVHFEAKPHFFSQWGTAVQQTGALGVERQTNGYALGLYSNWVSDRYSAADYICVLDPDMLFVSRAALPLMFDWDERQRAYKPVWICRDSPEDIFVQSSYALFGLNDTTAPGCMYQLPVCVHRSTLRRVRLRLNADFARANVSDYSSVGLDPAVDRDNEYEQYGRQYDTKRAEAGSVLPVRESGVPASAFDRTYMRMVNRDLQHAVCQFCVWGTFILQDEAERRLYSVHLQGVKDDSSECPHIRVATHSGYLVPAPKMSPAYYQLADRLLLEGTCHAALPTDCLAPICQRRGYWYDAMAARDAATALVPSAVLSQPLLYAWEKQDSFLSATHDKRCRAYCMAANQQLFEWTRSFDLADSTRRTRHCNRTALTDSSRG